MLRPLGHVSAAAVAIAGGRLDTRVAPIGDPDLGTLVNSFNDMASALQERIERDARFASDVSHELRSPLTTLTTAAEVLRSRRDELPDRSRLATVIDHHEHFQSSLRHDLHETRDGRIDCPWTHLGNHDALLLRVSVLSARTPGSAGLGPRARRS